MEYATALNKYHFVFKKKQKKNTHTKKQLLDNSAKRKIT